MTENFTNQQPFTVTEKQAHTYWGFHRKEGLRCYMCGCEIPEGSVARWIYAGGLGTINFIVCASCDGPDVIERWKSHVETAKQKYWWLWEH